LIEEYGNNPKDNNNDYLDFYENIDDINSLPNRDVILGSPHV
jgi:hypothetical protein